MNVLDFAKAKEERNPHITGMAQCLACQAKWMAVAPVGIEELECPECHLSKGRFANLCVREGPHFHCHCGNDLFYIKPDCSYCPNCGQEVVLP